MIVVEFHIFTVTVDQTNQLIGGTLAQKAPEGVRMGGAYVVVAEHDSFGLARGS